MNKTELVGAIASKTELTKVEVEKVVNAFVTVVGEELVSGNKVAIKGFGTFEARERAARQGHNPRTKEVIQIPASKAPGFKASSAFKDLLNK